MIYFMLGVIITLFIVLALSAKGTMTISVNDKGEGTGVYYEIDMHMDKLLTKKFIVMYIAKKKV